MRLQRTTRTVIFFFMALLVFTPTTAFAFNKLIRLATVPWDPICGPNLPNEGYFSEISREAFARVGYDLQIVWMPWKRCLHDTQNGYFDGLLAAYYSKARTEWLHYSDQVAETSIVFFCKQGRNITYRTLQDLTPYTIGVERGFVHTEEFDKADFLKKEPVKKLDMNLNKLLKDRIDLVAASREIFLYMVQTQYADKRALIQEISPPLAVSKIFNVFLKSRPDSAQVLNDFNRGLKMIREDGTFDNILKKHGIK
jgi:polar amino acid transport system substrate-binding protein